MSRPKENSKKKAKAILFIVEGLSEINMFQSVFEDLYEERKKETERPIKVFFCQYDDGFQIGGDITSKDGVTPDTIENVINKDIVNPFLITQKDKLYPKEIEEIIQIIDLDGAFVENNTIRKSDVSKTIYQEDRILALKPELIIERNERKRENIRKLLSLDYFLLNYNKGYLKKKVDYSVYYFSCNLDHFFHGDANMRGDKKIEKARDYGVLFWANKDTFFEWICNKELPCNNLTYEETWEYIMHDNHSLERNSNLNILIKRIKEKYY